MEHKEKDFSLSWFFKWFVDNKAITVFLVTLLMGLNILVLSKISFIFTPLLEFGAPLFWSLGEQSCYQLLFLGSSITS